MLVKAVIINMDEKLNKLNKIIPIKFNPPQLDIRKSLNYSKIENAHQNESEVVVLQGDNAELSMELFFDTTDLGVDVRNIGVDVRNITDKIVELARVNEVGEKPPHLMFVWGSMCFDCIMTSVNQKYEHFDALGQPLRAVLNVTLVGYDRLNEIRKNIPLDKIAVLTSYTVNDGDRIDVIAAKEKSDSKDWKSVASCNKIRNPLTIPSGTNLRIPE